MKIKDRPNSHISLPRELIIEELEPRLLYSGAPVTPPEATDNQKEVVLNAHHDVPYFEGIDAFLTDSAAQKETGGSLKKVSSHLKSASAPAAASTAFTDVPIDFTEPAFPTADGTVLTGDIGFNLIDDCTGTEHAATSGDKDDVTLSLSSSGANTGWIWDAGNSGQIQALHSFTGSVTSNNPGTRISNTLELRFADHLTVTDFSFDASSFNTAGNSWEFTVIEFLDPAGNPINAAPAIADYLNHTPYNPGEANPGQNGGTQSPGLSLPAGVYILDSKDTVEDVGTDQVSRGSSGDNEAFTRFGNSRIEYADVGLAAGTQIGGVRITTSLEDVRGVNNGATNFTAAMTDFTFSGTVNKTQVTSPGTQVEPGPQILQSIFGDHSQSGLFFDLYIPELSVDIESAPMMEPYFAGSSTPGATIEIVIRDEAGMVVGTGITRSDLAGNWSTGIEGDYSNAGIYKIEIRQAEPKWLDGENQKLLTCYTTAVIPHPSHLETRDSGQKVARIVQDSPESEALVQKLAQV